MFIGYYTLNFICPGPPRLDAILVAIIPAGAPFEVCHLVGELILFAQTPSKLLFIPTRLDTKGREVFPPVFLSGPRDLVKTWMMRSIFCSIYPLTPQ